MDAPTLILPVESRVRELDAKLLLAGAAAERGFRVILGARQQVSFALPRLPRGVFFAKSMRFTSDLVTGFVRGFGHHMVASDEESLVRFQHPDYCGWRYSPETFNALRHLFAWGQDDAEMLRAYPERGDVRVHATGNPRVDLLRRDVREVYRDKARALRRRYGGFILINTNFPFVNNFVPSLNLIRTSRSGIPAVSRTGRGMSLPFALAMARHQQAIADAFAALVPVLAARFPRRRIILRPHPSENHDHWRALTRGLPNVAVLHEDTVVPWLMAADVLVHNGCTTAVESALLGTPAVTYQPVAVEYLDYHLPNGLSVVARTATEVVDAVAAVPGDEGLGPATRCTLLTRHLEMSSDRLAADRILDVLEEAGYLREPPPAPPIAARSRAWLGTRIRTMVKRANMRRPNHRNSHAYLRHRFPPLATTEVQARLDGLGTSLGRFHDVRVRPLDLDLFAIESQRHGLAR